MRAAKRTQKGVGHPDRDTRIEAARCRKCAQRIRGAGIGSAPPVLGEVFGEDQACAVIATEAFFNSRLPP